MSARPRAIVVVAEGMTPALLRPQMAEGLLPALAALHGDGASGAMVAASVPYEPPGLLSATTGYSPGDHGWHSYWTVHAPDYRPATLTSADRLRPFLWERDELRGRRFGVVNVFGTHPPAPLDGWCISYPTEQTLHTTHPRELALQLARGGVRVVHDVSVWFSGQARDLFTGRVLAADMARGEAALHLYRAGADAVIVNLTAIDRLSHVYWQELEPGSTISPQSCAIRSAYAVADSVVSRLRCAADDATSVLVFSEIGFGPLRAYCSLDDHLAAAGLLRRDRAGERERVDWSRTVAFEAVQGTSGVNINLRGRQGEGTVLPAAYEAVRDEVSDVLRSAVNPHTGLPLAAAVRRREEVYRGENVHLAPDLVVTPYDQRYLPLGDRQWSDHVHRTWQSGWHRAESAWFGAGPAFRSRTEQRAASPVDVAATVVAMLGAAMPAGVVGTPLGCAA